MKTNGKKSNLSEEKKLITLKSKNLTPLKELEKKLVKEESLQSVILKMGIRSDSSGHHTLFIWIKGDRTAEEIMRVHMDHYKEYKRKKHGKHESE